MTPRESAAVAAPAEQGRQGPPEQVPPRPAPAGADPRSRRRLVVAGALLLVAALGGFAVWRLFFASASLPPGVIAVSGRIEGDDSAIAPKTSGRIREISVREGDQVSAGAVVAVLDDEQI